MNRHRQIASRTSLLGAVAVLLCAAGSAGAAEVITVRAGDHPKFTRVVFELDSATGYRVERIGTDERPVLRVSVDAASRGYDLRATGDVRGVKVTGGAQAVAEIELSKPGLRLQEMILSKPYRIVLDLMKPETALAAAPSPKRPAAKPKKAEPAAPPQVARTAPAPAPAPSPKAESKPAEPAPVAPAKAPAPKAEVKAPAPVTPAKAPAPEKPAPEAKPAPATAAAKPVPPKPAPAIARVTPAPPAEEPKPAAAPPVAPVVPRSLEEPESVARAEEPKPTPSAAQPKPLPGSENPPTPPAAAPKPTEPEATAKAPPARPALPPAPALEKPKPRPSLPAAPASSPTSWVDRLTGQRYWLAGIAAALLGLVVLVVVLAARRRRALPNDLDVTAIAEEVEETSPEASEGLDFSQSAASDSSSSEDSPFAGLFDDADEPAPRGTAQPSAAPGAPQSAPAEAASGSGSLFEDAGGLVGEDTPHGDVPMNQDTDLPADPNRTMPRMGGSAAYDAGGASAESTPDVVRMLKEFERRITTLEAKLDEANEAREKLERQVAAQSEELRVQRAAIARTQRALRTMSRGDEDKATEPALRDGDTQAKTRVNV